MPEDDTQKILGLQMWNTYSGITQFRWDPVGGSLVPRWFLQTQLQTGWVSTLGGFLSICHIIHIQHPSIAKTQTPKCAGGGGANTGPF